MAVFYTPEEIAAELKVHKRTVYVWLRKGELKGHKIGDLWRVSEEDYKEFLEQRRKLPNE